MNITEINGVFERLKRLSSRLDKKVGEGYQWTYTFPDGVETTYILKNIKNFEEMEDDIANLFIWVWNLKDYLKKFAKAMSRSPQEVEDIINSDKNLQICGDIANGLKHGPERKSRSYILSRLQYEIPHTALSSLTYRGKEVELNIAKTEEVILSRPILDKEGNEIGDGLKILSDGLNRFEKYFNKITKTSQQQNRGDRE
jgi:hypothetical protein